MSAAAAAMSVTVFGRHAQLCASHQWEVIVGVVTFTICMLTANEPFATVTVPPAHCKMPREYAGVDAVAMTAVRCVALLYTYHQFRKLHAVGSKYLLGFAGLFVVISTFVFTSSIINFMNSGISDLKDALFFFLLLIDLSKVSRLAQYALAAPSASQLPAAIGAGMTLLAPQITLDVLLEVLLISVGTLSGVHRLEVLCCYACMSAVISYLMFLMFYPACLSLVLQITGEADDTSWRSLGAATFSQLLSEDAGKPNVVVQRIKIIMTVALAFVHFICRWPVQEAVDPLHLLAPRVNSAGTCDPPLSSSYSALVRWIGFSAEHLGILIIVLSLVVKYVLFEQQDSPAPARASAPPSASLNPAAPTLPVESSHNTETPASPGDPSPQQQQQCLSLSRDDCDSESTQEDSDDSADTPRQPPRPLSVCQQLLEEGASCLTDCELLQLVRHRLLRLHQLERQLGDCERAVMLRRRFLLEQLQQLPPPPAAAGGQQPCLQQLPYRGYEYERVHNTCCENVIGYVPLPVGVVGPLLLDGHKVFVPLATTEGALVASTNRGCVALSHCGVSSYVIADGMTRAPVIECPDARTASEIVAWLKVSSNYSALKSAFDSTSRFARLSDIQASMFGRQVFVRFVAQTGDAMGMNMVSKGTERAVEKLKEFFPDIVVTSVSSNVCTDKKPSAVNWIRGRGKSVVCECVVSGAVVRDTLKTSVEALVNVCLKKNLIGSAVAGSIGGNNAHAANIVTAIYIATGQDPAQNVGSSSCMTLLEPWGAGGQDLYITCTMPCIEVGTVGGGTTLSAQSACLQLLNCQGASASEPGSNARRLASVVCATVMAGELSLLAAQSAGHLVKSHLLLNRSNGARS